MFRIQKFVWIVSEHLGIYFTHLSLLLFLSGLILGSKLLIGISILMLFVLVSKWIKLKGSLLQTFNFWSPSSPLPHMTLQLSNGKKADVYLSQKPQSPALIFLFGGGFVSGDIKQNPYLNLVFNQLNFHTVQLEYSYLPSHDLDATLEELKVSIQEVLNFKNKEFEPQSYILGGRSAGAYLALHASRYFPNSKISKLFLLYPPVIITKWLSEFFPQLLLPMKTIKENYFSNQKTSIDLNKLQDFSKNINYWIVTGDQDLMVPHQHSLELKEHLKKLGCDVVLDIVPTEPHGFEASINTLGGQQFIKLLTYSLAAKTHT